MGNPGETFVGVSAVGIGVLLIYAAYKNEPVLGSKGLLSQVFTTGHLQSATPQTAPKTSTAQPPNAMLIPNAPTTFTV
jgi:hypothetical protein